MNKWLKWILIAAAIGGAAYGGYRLWTTLKNNDDENATQ